MKDYTYDKEVIDSNAASQLAFQLSEILNDNAPIGWTEYLPIAKILCSPHAYPDIYKIISDVKNKLGEEL